MTTTGAALSEDGVLVLPRPLSLSENLHRSGTIESDPARKAWLELSEEPLAKDWDDGTDAVFNQLAAMAKDPQIQHERRSLSTAVAALKPRRA